MSLSGSLGTVPCYTKKEEAELGRLVAAGDAEAREQLILSVVPWGIRIANRYHNGPAGPDEAISDAMIGVIKAVDRFEPERGRLTTLVEYCVRTEIWRNSPSHRLIRIPNTAMKDNPDRTAKTARLVYAALCPFSLDGENDSQSSASGEVDPAEQLETADEYRRAWKALATLTPRWRKVIILHVMHGWTLAEVGKALGVTKTRVGQIRKKAIQQLHEKFEIKDE